MFKLLVNGKEAVANAKAQTLKVAVKNGDSLVVADSATGKSPAKLITKKVNKDLLIFEEGVDKASVVLEDYYAEGNVVQLGGVSQSGSMLAYSVADGGFALAPVAEAVGATAATTAATTSMSTVAMVGFSVLAIGGAGVLRVASTGESSSAPTALTTTADTTAPTFTNSATVIAIAENSGAGQVICTATATDTSALTYTLKNIEDVSLLSINNSTGAVTLTANPDFETKSNYSFTVVATDSAGNISEQVVTLSVNDVFETTTLIGTDLVDTLNHSTGIDNFIIKGLAGDDTISTGSGNDIVRPGEGVDTINTGSANDIVVVVGETAANQYTQDDIANPGGSGIDLSSVIALSDLNGRTVSEVSAGESIDGGTGTNRLVIYGTIDLTGVTLSNITQMQVNSNVTITAQQLNALPINLIFGDGESVLNITNSGAEPITFDLSGIGFTGFQTLNISSGVTLIVDQSDIDSLQYLSGGGTIQASSASSTLNLSGKHTTLIIKDKNGVDDVTHGGAAYLTGKLLIGSESADALSGGSDNDRLEGGMGNDTLSGGEGNDILRGGGGVDTMDGSAGDDKFIIVGDISGGGKVDSVEDTSALGFNLTTLNGKNLNEDEDGATEIIWGGDGDDTLYVYGTADISNYDITGIEHIEIRSDVTFSAKFLNNLVKTGAITLAGDGTSIVRIDGGTAANPLVLDLTALNTVKLSNIGQLALGEHVVLKINDLSELGGARILTGNGEIQATTALSLPNTLSVQNNLILINIDSSKVEKLADVIDKKNGEITDTTGSDYLRGTDYTDIFKSINGGDDVLTGKKGSDVFKVAGNGKKIIIDVAEQDNGSDKDTLDLSLATGSANVNLSNGGSVGTTTIQLGSGSATGGTQQTASKFNLMLIMDVSGSMGWGYPTRLSLAQKAANDLMDAYDKLGDVSVRIVKFSYGATSNFNGKDEWMDVTTSKSIINSLYADGGTPYDAAMDVAKTAFPSGKGNIYYENGSNVSFFLSDGEPNYSIYNKESDWENFLIANQIQSNALGFGGLNNTYHLEPIAFDGTKIKSLTDDHATGEIPAIVTFDASKLGETLISQAKLDFIENLVGTAQDDILTGNDLDNRIDGGKNDDVLTGLGGNDAIYGGEGKDIVTFRGVKNEYTIVDSGAFFTVSDKVAGRDGVDSIYAETLRFKDVDYNISSTETKNDYVHLNFKDNYEIPKFDKIWKIFDTTLLENYHFSNVSGIGTTNDLNYLNVTSKLDVSKIGFSAPLNIKADSYAYDINYNVDTRIDIPESVIKGDQLIIKTFKGIESSAFFEVHAPNISASLGLVADVNATASIMIDGDLIGIDPFKGALLDVEMNPLNIGSLLAIDLGGSIYSKDIELGDLFRESKHLMNKYYTKANKALVGKMSNVLSVEVNLEIDGDKSDELKIDNDDSYKNISSKLSFGGMEITLDIDDLIGIIPSPYTKPFAYADSNTKKKDLFGIEGFDIEADLKGIGFDLVGKISPILDYSFDVDNIEMITKANGYEYKTFLGNDLSLDTSSFIGSDINIDTEYHLLGNMLIDFGLSGSLEADLKALGYDISSSYKGFDVFHNKSDFDDTLAKKTFLLDESKSILDGVYDMGNIWTIPFDVSVKGDSYSVLLA